jgi:TonB-dependent SusC/RagA subfamily outer membrane receptor
MRFKALFLLILLISLPGFTYGQRAKRKMTISGKVTDAKQKPVQGAVIFIDKVKTDVVTDDQGLYRIRVRSDAKEILVFTLFNGTVEEMINGRTTIDFVLTGNSQAGKSDMTGNEADKNTGGDPQKKDGVSGAMVMDRNDARYATYQTIYDMIRGRFAGVEVSGKSIKVIGASSLNVSTEPLFVVDGVIVSSIDDISPQTVKSIEVLKGPDATAYGIRGSNGVILITRFTGKDK